MKISIFDHVRKFSADLIKHWEDSGHEVKWDRYFHPDLVRWADMSFFEFCDNSIQSACLKDHDLWKDRPQPQDKNIIVRLHDIDAWVGHHLSVNWEWVTNLVFVCDHIHDKVVLDLTEKNKLPDFLKVHTIKHGINLDKFTYRDKLKGNKIAWVGNICHHKCLELALQVLAENPEYELHAVGSSLDSWELAYVESFVKRNKLKFFYYPSVGDMNTFLEDKHYILLTSFKEAFSFIVGEAMAKGLRPLIHNFWGAEGVWDKKYIWNKVSEVKPMLNDYNPIEYRQYIEKYYPLKKMLLEYDKLL